VKKTVLNLGSTPLADQFPATSYEARSQDYFPLGLILDDHKWSLDLTYLVPDELLFGDDYAFFTGSSPALVSYFAEYADWAQRYFGPDLLAEGVCEIACNDGTLLANLKEYRHLGIDPAKPAVKVARRKGLNVLHQAFDADTAHEVEGPFGLVIANNVAAHVASLEDLLAGIAYLARDGGFGVIEFQYAGDLISDCLWPLVYHEHRRFLSLSSFMAACPVGLRVVDVVRTPAQGGSLRVVVTTALGATPTVNVTDLQGNESWLRRTDTYSSLQGRVDYQAIRLQDSVSAFQTVALYGAPAKATTLVHYAELTHSLDYAVDLTPHKIGRCLPGTAIPVIHPDQETDRPAAYLVSLPNYLPSILRREHEFLANGGRLILPDGTVI
jgi:SAM-dependent methyltransferase